MKQIAHVRSRHDFFFASHHSISSMPEVAAPPWHNTSEQCLAIMSSSAKVPTTNSGPDYSCFHRLRASTPRLRKLNEDFPLLLRHNISNFWHTSSKAVPLQTHPNSRCTGQAGHIESCLVNRCLPIRILPLSHASYSTSRYPEPLT